MLFSLCACARQNVNSTEPQTSGTTVSTTAAPPAWQWQKDSPQNQGVDPAVLNDVHETFDSFPLLSSVIVRNGYIVDEYYKDGYDENSVFVLNSASKSVTSALIGIAVDMGLIESVDVPISTYFPQVLENGGYWAEITIRHLLTHTSGIDMSDTADWYDWRSSANWVQYILDRSVTSRPGTVFNYSTGNTHLLSAILQQASGMTLEEFGKRYLFDPMEMNSASVSADAQGISDGGNGVSMNIYDMAKFGMLYLTAANGRAVSWFRRTGSHSLQPFSLNVIPAPPITATSCGCAPLGITITRHILHRGTRVSISLLFRIFSLLSL